LFFQASITNCSAAITGLSFSSSAYPNSQSDLAMFEIND